MQWMEKRQKWDKIPHNAYQPQYGVSTAKPDAWADYETAIAAFKQHKKAFAGLGYLMTGAHGIVGTDLDDCFDEDGLQPWAAKIVKRLNTYTELSPSGNGLRLFSLGEIDEDWNNHEVGIEVYGGSAPRFLTVTGCHLPGTPLRVTKAPPNVFNTMAQQFKKERKSLAVDSSPMPEIGDDEDLPEYRSGLTRKAKEFLDSGENGGDRSRALFATAVSLSASGLTPEQCFTVMAQNEHAMECALAHRHDDYDRALQYIWTEQCEKGKIRADETKGPSARDFEDLIDDFHTEPEPRTLKTRYDCEDLLYSTTEEPEPTNPADDFADYDEEPSRAKQAATVSGSRFTFEQVGPFSASAMDVAYLIDDVIPKAGLAIMYGESGSGKSFLAIDFAMAIANGTKWRDHDTEQGNVAYVCAEGAGGFKRRMTAYATYNDYDLNAAPFYVLGDAPNLSEVEDTRELIKALKLVKPKIVFIDTLAQSFVGNENSGEDIGRVLAHCKAIHKITGATVVLVHHSGKDTTKGARGHSSLRAACDAEIEILREGDTRSATVTKMKDGDDGREYGFKLITVDLGVNSKGKAITSCVVEHTEDSPKAAKDAAKAEGKTGIKGTYEIAVVEIISTFNAFNPDEIVAADEVIDAVMQRFPVGDGRDRRRECTLRAIESLAKTGKLDKNNGLRLIQGGVPK